MNDNFEFKVRKSIFKGIDYYIQQQRKGVTKTCPNAPPSVLKKVNRIVVIGDLHGDLFAMLYALYIAGVINEYSEWIGSDTVVVQLGDQIDKGGRGLSSVDNTNDPTEELRIMEYMHHLHFEAKEQGGAVYNLLGNHELMNILGDFRYATGEHVMGFGGNSVRKELFKPGGVIAKKLACNTNGILKIGDWVFVHAGLLPHHVQHRTIPQINQIVRDILLGNININNMDQNTEDLVFNSNGFLWNREYSMNTDQNSCRLLNQTLEIVNGSNKGGMVVGHTIKDNITSACNNKATGKPQLYMADVGMSTAFGPKNQNKDRVQVLEIIDNGKIVRPITKLNNYSINCPNCNKSKNDRNNNDYESWSSSDEN